MQDVGRMGNTATRTRKGVDILCKRDGIESLKITRSPTNCISMEWRGIESESRSLTAAIRRTQGMRKESFMVSSERCCHHNRYAKGTKTSHHKPDWWNAAFRGSTMRAIWSMNLSSWVPMQSVNEKDSTERGWIQWKENAYFRSTPKQNINERKHALTANSVIIR